MKLIFKFQRINIIEESKTKKEDIAFVPGTFDHASYYNNGTKLWWFNENTVLAYNNFGAFRCLDTG